MEDVFYYPARIVRAQLGPLFPGDGELLARYRERFPDSPVETPYFLRTEISNNSLDWYFTHMRTSSLQNFAQDAENGVGLQDSHNSRNLGYGRSLYGRYLSEPGLAPGWDRPPRRGNSDARPAIEPPQTYERTLSAAHVAPGLKFNSNTYASTDDFIAAVESGSVEEISVGFLPGSMSCDICGMNYLSWDCPHIAGFAYAIEREDEEIDLMTTVSIGGAHLFEYSAVYAGATPNAVVVRKAEREAEAGRLTQKQAAAIEQRYRVRLPAAGYYWAGFSSSATGENSLVIAGSAISGSRDAAVENTNNNEGANSMETEELLNAIQSLLSETEAPESENLIDGVRWLVEENARLQPLAEQGEQYRSDLIEQALAEGVRAMGNEFPRETYERMLEDADAGHIKEVRDAWAKQAQELFSKGRITVDEEQTPPPEREPTGSIPKSAYKS